MDNDFPIIPSDAVPEGMEKLRAAAASGNIEAIKSINEFGRERRFLSLLLNMDEDEC